MPQPWFAGRNEAEQRLSENPISDCQTSTRQAAAQSITLDGFVSNGSPNEGNELQIAAGSRRCLVVQRQQRFIELRRFNLQPFSADG